MGGFFDFKEMNKALDAEYPQGPSAKDVNDFCKKHLIIGEAKTMFLACLPYPLDPPRD